jgi:hypothetical protein
LVLALCLIAAGVAAMVFLLFYADYVKGWMLMAAGLVFAVGAVWLYSDFIDATPNEERDNATRP